MFFLIEREEILALPPKYFGKKVDKEVLNQLRAKVEGKCSGRYGFTIVVTNLAHVGAGRLHEDTGYAHFPVRYLALVFRPFKNEILPTKVTTINQSGFFATAGPLEIFVSKLSMPDDLKFDPKDGQPSFYSEAEDIRIEAGSLVRVKIVGMRLATDQIITIGTIKDDFLGPTD